MREYAAGRVESFELLVRRHAPSVYQFALRFTRSAAASEDVVQETFLQVSLSAATFDVSRRFRPWLFTIAANKARDYLRHRQRRRELPLEAPLDDPDSSRRFLDMLVRDEDEARDELESDERRRVVRAAVESMPPQLWEVLVLSYYHRFRYREIAEILDIPLGTVKSRLHSAVAAFAERYRELTEQRLRRTTALSEVNDRL